MHCNEEDAVSMLCTVCISRDSNFVQDNAHLYDGNVKMCFVNVDSAHAYNNLP